MIGSGGVDACANKVISGWQLDRRGVIFSHSLMSCSVARTTHEDLGLKIVAAGVVL